MCEDARQRHTPVLLTAVLDVLSLAKGERVLDCTLGLGGHASAFLAAIGEQGVLTGLDADEENLSSARVRLAQPNAHLIRTNFSSLPDCLPPTERSFDAVFADLGLSSPHIDEPDRGFSFRPGTSLDMRYDRTEGRTAADLLQRATEQELVRIFQEYGELPKTYRFVASILASRDALPIATSDDLMDLIRGLYGHTANAVAPQIFQALRIAVNDELGALTHLLRVAPGLLRPGGRMAIISYHSLEDRLVKHAFRHLSAPEKDEKTGAVRTPARFALLTKKPLLPAKEEIENNPRARSAKLRAVKFLS